MTPAEYDAALKRLDLTHEQAGALLGIHPVTSRKYAKDMQPIMEPVARLLRLIEALGLKRARKILSL